MSVKFTVFTPTYNRAHSLHRVFKSLDAQTFRNFEWLIIDDGSSDNTIELIELYKSRANFSIRLFSQKNSHKFFCLIKGISLAVGEYFVPFDSDDECDYNTFERLDQVLNEYEIDTNDMIVGVCCLCKDQNHTLIGSKYPQNLRIFSHLELFHKYRLKGEKWGILKTKILRNYSFSKDFFNNGYIPEGILWGQLSVDGFKVLVLNETLRTYFVEENNSSIMNDSKNNYYKNSFGIVESAVFNLNNTIKYFFNSPFQYLLNNLLYFCFSRIRKISFRDQLKRLLWRPKLIYIMGTPFFYLYYRYKFKNK
ncbi:MAG: glycosyltransferase family 2 protein [Saprospiraceae bacterium]|jgi:glycosyltransferase involved in cell wall biosynthesis|nr:glycosyltransferase family 2 protein [Saprospiraceae bacterium]